MSRPDRDPRVDAALREAAQRPATYARGERVEFCPVSCRDTAAVQWREGEYVAPAGDTVGRGWHRVKIDAFGTIDTIPSRRLRPLTPRLAVPHGDVTYERIARATPEELVAGARHVTRPLSARALGIAPRQHKVAGVREVGWRTPDAADEPAPPTADEPTPPPPSSPAPGSADRNTRARQARAARGLLQTPREGAGRPAEAGARRDVRVAVPVTPDEKAALIELAGGKGHVADLLRRAPARLEQWRAVARQLADAAADAGVGPDDPALAEYVALETEEVG